MATITLEPTFTIPAPELTLERITAVKDTAGDSPFTLTAEGTVSKVIDAIVLSPVSVEFTLTADAHPDLVIPVAGPPGGMWNDDDATWIFTPDELWEPEV